MAQTKQNGHLPKRLMIPDPPVMIIDIDSRAINAADDARDEFLDIKLVLYII